MWDSLKSWFTKNKMLLASMLPAALIAGLLLATVSFYFPPVLMLISSISLLGFTPLAFLSTIPTSIAALALGSITAGLTLATSVITTILIHQIKTISHHVSALFNENTHVHPTTVVHSPYLHPELNRTRSIDEFDEDDSDEDDINDVSSASEQEVEEEFIDKNLEITSTCAH